MPGILTKALAAIAIAGVGAAIVSSVFLTNESETDQASSADSARDDTPGLESNEPWRQEMVAVECPHLPSRDGARLLVGNWMARWDGVPNRRFFIGGRYLDSAHLTIRSNEDTGKFSVRGPSWHRNGALNISERPDRTEMINTIELESVTSNALRTSLAFYSAPDSTLHLNPASPDRLSGSWKIRNKDADGEVELDGSVTWERAIPTVNRIVVRSEKTVDAVASVDNEPDNELCGARLVRAPVPAVATLTYDKDDWDIQISRLRANRPRFYVEIYGDNFWGDHRVDFDFTNTGIEGVLDRQIRADDGSGRIVGLSIRFNVWEGVQPGWYTVYVDGMAIPFQLDIPNFYPSVTLTYVNYDPTNDTERELQEIPVNQAFWVRARVRNPERFDDTAPLIVRWRDQEYSATAKKLDSGHYRAGPFMVSDTLLPSTVVPERDPCENERGAQR